MSKLFIVLSFVLLACRKEPVEIAVVSVPSSICEQCVHTIQKATMKVEGVRKVTVDLDSKLAHVEYAPGRPLVGEIEKAIVFAGYDANEFKADKDAYDKLPDCCKK